MPRAFFFNAAIIILTQFLTTGCGNENYLVHEVVKETIVEVEVPVYIETEIPTDSEDAEVWVDSFTQPRSVDGIDILWVIDTSGSMNRYDENLLHGIGTMLSALPPSGWRLAMTSNDPASAATESQFPLVPGDDILDAEAMYSSMGRGGREEGFDAAYEYIVNNPYASTWMRPDAALLVVFVSDEEDQSDSHFPSVQDFITWYQGQRGGSSFISSIINVEEADSVCLGAVNSIDIGRRYMEATNWFAGVIVDICSDDWSPGVRDATVTLEPHEEWSLTHIPIVPTIRVFIDGQLNWDWTYNSGTNSVIFTIIPSAAEHVEIGYVIDQTPEGDTGDTG